MKILDTDNQELAPESVDGNRGYLTKDRLLIAHYDAVEAVQEQWHYEYRQYPNGGRDAEKVVDIPGVEAREARDEYEDILRYIPYMPEELATREAEQEAATERQQRLEALLKDGVLQEELGGLVKNILINLLMKGVEQSVDE